MTLLDACREVMADRSVTAKYSEGLNAGDVLTEIRAKHPDAFPLVSVIDVADEMRSFFGTPGAGKGRVVKRWIEWWRARPRREQRRYGQFGRCYVFSPPDPEAIKRITAEGGSQ